MANELGDMEDRVEIGGVPARMLMGIDADGNKRFLRCDEEGYLICKVVAIDAGELEEA